MSSSRPATTPATGSRATASSTRPRSPRYTRRLADRVGEVFDRGDRLLLLGGDCSILFGPALALRRRGETIVVPGLLQTQAYASALTEATVGNPDPIGPDWGG